MDVAGLVERASEVVNNLRHGALQHTEAVPLLVVGLLQQAVRSPGFGNILLGPECA